MSTDEIDSAITPRSYEPAQDAVPSYSPEPTGEGRYTDPLAKYLHEDVRVEWCGHEVEGTVVQINNDHVPECFLEQLVVETDVATLIVSPEDIVSE